jgi:transglutaminase-like putative cysteine protease
MKNSSLCLLTVFSLLLGSCSGDHLIRDEKYREKVRKDYLSRTVLAKNREKELFSFSGKKLSDGQREAVEFLFAYMPLSDLADYDGDFFLENADLALRTRKDSPWGKSVPENIFLHYVLPVRVNNENLDRFRIEYYDEISSRIRGMDARSSALEINHWCHEKVSYQPSDIRTSSPLNTILSSRGRCGEESTFAVAALRTAGLPARQVYTPRWAHSDDNHAWVEVWIEGNWYYMGACEPEPVLDRGWFTEPARRAMLIHTKSFGAPFGENNLILSRRNYSIVNNLSKYALTKTIRVKTLNAGGKPAAGAEVEFQLYNYSEFYPLAVVNTDVNGLCSFETGLGDLMIWARQGNDFNYRKITVNETDTLTLVLDRKPEDKGYYEYDLGVPVTRTPYEGPAPEIVSKNNEQLNAENSIRQEYADKWMKPGEAVKLASDKGADTAVVRDLIARSMGNGGSISNFISRTQPADISLAIKILTLLAEKDLRDTREDVLRDHLSNCVRYDRSGAGYDEAVYNDYMLNPRIANENLVSWRGYLRENLPIEIRSRALKDPDILVKYVKETITLNDSDNYYKTPLTPIGVYKLKISDSFSRDIYLIAICRTLGIPARLEPGSNRPQYYMAGVWHDVSFSSETSVPGIRGYIRLFSTEKQPVPEYYIHFTLAKFENGRYNTLEYDYNKRITDFRDELALSPGYYMLVTGNRINDSRILSSVTFFELNGNEHKKIEVKLRKDNSAPVIPGSIK